jgi:hypothetical protein
MYRVGLAIDFSAIDKHFFLSSLPVFYLYRIYFRLEIIFNYRQGQRRCGATPQK